MARLIFAAGEFVTEGERQAAEELRKLPDDWIVIANKVLPASNDRSYEIDFIVIGDHPVFAIDEKSWRGRIYGSDALWVRENGSSQRSPLNKIDYVAKVLAGHLANRVAGFASGQRCVVGCVLLTATANRPAIRDPRAAKGVLLLSEATKRLVERDHSEGDARIGDLRAKIEKALFDLADRPRFPRQIDMYTIVEVTGGRPGCYICQATHALGGERVLSVYDLSSRDPGLREFYLQEYRALAQLRPTGVAPEVSDPFEWSEDFLVIACHVPDGKSLSAVPRPDSQNAAARELARAAAAFRALARIQDTGIVHRAISPH